MEVGWLLLLIYPLIFLAGLIDAVVGGGGLISLPAYLACGLPPHMAVATNKCSSTFGTLTATFRYIKEKKVHYLAAVCSAVAALIGSPIGAFLNLYIDEKYIRWVLLIVIPIAAFLILTKRDLGAENHADDCSKKKIAIWCSILGFLIGMYDGFLGPGTGTFLILAFTALLRFDMLTASATSKVVNSASNLAGFVVFAFNGTIVWHIGIPGALFGIAGNWVGSKLALKNDQRIFRPLLLVVLGLLVIKMLYDLFLG